MRRFVWTVAAIIVLLLFICLPALADELYVGAEGGYESLTAAVKAAVPGDVIHLASGTYDESSETYPIIIDKPLSLAGDPGAVLKGPPFKALLKVNVPDVSIEGVTFQLLRWGIVDTGNNMYLKDCCFVLADAAYRVSSCGVWMAGVYNCSITGCDFTGCGVCLAGPPLSERSNVLPVLTGLFEVGEDTAFFTSHTIRDNRVNGKPMYFYENKTGLVIPKDAGAVIAVCCDQVKVGGIDVSDCSMGLELIHCSNVQVEQVTADRCGLFGIYLAYVEMGSVEKVTCRGSNHGIDLRAVQNLAVTDCVANECEQGIFLSHAYDCIVDNCKMRNCGNGFFIAAGARNQLSGSRVEGNDNGIYVQGEKDMLVCGNGITGNTVSGLRFLRSGGQVLDNTLVENQTGVLAAEDETLTLWKNTFDGNISSALYMKDITAGKISFNDFGSHEKVFITLDGFIADTLIWQNIFHGGLDRVTNTSESQISIDKNDWLE